MRDLVETLESTLSSHPHNTCGKQRRLFKALYDVAAKYVEVKSRADCGSGDMSWPMARQQYVETTANGLGIGTLASGGVTGDLGTTNIIDAPGKIPPHSEVSGVGMGHIDEPEGPTALQNAAFGDVDMEMDISGTELWDWFNKNQAILRMLEDT